MQHRARGEYMYVCVYGVVIVPTQPTHSVQHGVVINGCSIPMDSMSASESFPRPINRQGPIMAER